MPLRWRGLAYKAVLKRQNIFDWGLDRYLQIKCNPNLIKICWMYKILILVIYSSSGASPDSTALISGPLGELEGVGNGRAGGRIKDGGSGDCSGGSGDVGGHGDIWDIMWRCLSASRRRRCSSSCCWSTADTWADCCAKAVWKRGGECGVAPLEPDERDPERRDTSKGGGFREYLLEMHDSSQSHLDWLVKQLPPYRSSKILEVAKIVNSHFVK